MISPHTPPGTKVVCIDASECEDYLAVGEVYTLERIEHSEFCVLTQDVEDAFAAYLYEVEIDDVPEFLDEVGFDLRRFRLADLPRCLTELLEPVNLPREALV